jgi:UDP-perosamine 4-acetyltransferase
MKSTKKPYLILGSGGHAGVLIEILSELDEEILGLIDPNEKLGEKKFGIEVIGNDERIKDFNKDKILLVNGIGSFPKHDQRKVIGSVMRENGYKFSSVVHPKAEISKSCLISEGVQIMAGTVIQHNVSIGIDSIINTGALIDHECSIGNHCHVAPGSVLSGNVTLGDYVHIGTGSSVIQEINIGEGSIVAAGSVVFRNIKPREKFIQHLKEK